MNDDRIDVSTMDGRAARRHGTYHTTASGLQCKQMKGGCSKAIKSSET